jgi:hypothetical protein
VTRQVTQRAAEELFECDVRVEDSRITIEARDTQCRVLEDRPQPQRLVW